MKTTKLIPAGFLVTALALSGAVVATAQNVPEASPGAERAKIVKAEARGDGRHRGQGHHRGHGRHGGGEIFRNLFNAVDADGNGAVTQEEVDAFRAAKLAEADTSGDGALSIEEFDTLYREFTRPRMVDMFQDLDADGDGVIGTAEMDDRFGRIVERMDRNDDGALTLQRRDRDRQRDRDDD